MMNIRQKEMATEYELYGPIGIKNLLKLLVKELHTTSKPFLKYVYNDLNDRPLMVCIKYRKEVIENLIKLHPRIGKSQFKIYVHNMKLFNMMDIYLKDKGQIIKVISVLK